MDVQVVVDESGPYPVVAIRGDLEEGSLDHLGSHLNRVAAEGHTDVIIDLSSVTDVDGVGAGTLLQLVFTIGWNDAHVVLVDARPSVMAEFQRSHIARVFYFARSIESAVRILDRRLT